MALREIRVEGDPVLTKVCKEIKEVTPRIQDLIESEYPEITQKRNIYLLVNIGSSIIYHEPQGM